MVGKIKNDKMDKKTLLLVIIVAIIIMAQQGKKEAISAYRCVDIIDDGGINYYQYGKVKVEAYSTITQEWYLVIEREDRCYDSVLNEIWCIPGVEPLDPNPSGAIEYNCENGCLNGECSQSITYISFVNYKDSYLSGGDFAAFISNANQWIGV